MLQLVQLSDGGRVHSQLTDWFAAFARDPSRGMEVAFEAGVGGSDPVLTFSPPVPA
jgi:hypothetical protein